MRQNRWMWRLFALVVLGVLGWMAFRREPAVITLEDGATLRLLTITHGRVHAYEPPLWQQWLERFGLSVPRYGLVPILSTPDIETWVWLVQTVPPLKGMYYPRVYLVDSQGARLPVKIQGTLASNAQEHVWVVQLPHLPAKERTAWLELGSIDALPSEKRRLRINLPYTARTPKNMHPKPLPARLKTPEFEFELQQLAVKEGATLPLGNKEYILRRLAPQFRFLEQGGPTRLWIVSHYWLEDPYGNRYTAGEAPPWHYPFWVFCAQVHPAPNNPKATEWQSGWIMLRRGKDTPIGETVSRYAETLHLLGISEHPSLQLVVNPATPDQYRVVATGSSVPNQLGAERPAQVSSTGAGAWKVEAKVPVVLLYLPLGTRSGFSYSSNEESLTLNNKKVRITVEDERGQRYPVKCVSHALSSDFAAVLVAGAIEGLPSAARRVRVCVKVDAAREIRLPVPPMSREDVEQVWQAEFVRDYSQP